MSPEEPHPHRLTYTAKAHADRSGFFLSLTPDVLLSLFSIGLGIGSLTYAILDPGGMLGFFTAAFVWIVAAIQMVFAAVMTMKSLLSNHATWGDYVLLVCVWIFGVGGSVLSVVLAG